MILRLSLSHWSTFSGKCHDRHPVTDAWILPQFTNHSDGSMLLTEGCILSVNSAISLRNVVRILICLHTFSLNAPQESWDSNLAWSFLVSLDNLLQDVCFPLKLHFDHYLHFRTLGWCLGLWIGGFCTRGMYLAVLGTMRASAEEGLWHIFGRITIFVNLRLSLVSN